MTETTDTPSTATDAQSTRDLPHSIVIPPIRGEMVHLRPATVEDLSCLDDLDAFYGASKITGKDAATERDIVHTWVRRSQAWETGQEAAESGVGDAESRRTIAWALLTDADHDDDGRIDAASTDNVIGMIFLIDIDGWSRSARIQILLGREFRGRGYSRDAMPRVMTYGFAPEPSGLGMHRIWVGVPEKNTRSISVYQSLGFVPSGASRDALWDVENNKYQDLIVMDTLVDEYDPIRSLEAFGMHLVEGNPGVKEALSAREHSVSIQQHKPKISVRQLRDTTGDAANAAKAAKDGAGAASDGNAQGAAGITQGDVAGRQRPAAEPSGGSTQADGQRADEPRSGSPKGGSHANAHHNPDDENNWPYGQSERKTSKEAWWRTLGRGRKRDTEGE
jgi:RimJ/RimL family protein N-acetyltransferase